MHHIQLPLSNFRAVIFDMDGTMVNNAAYHKKAWQKLLQQHGISLTEEEFQRKVSGKKNDKILEIIFGKKLPKEDEAQYADKKEALYRELFAPDIKEVAGLTSLIKALEAYKLRMAIATTAPKKNREFVLSELGLHGKFDVILGDEHVGNGKPHPEIYLEAAKKLGLDPGKCLVFEDSPPGVTAGKNAGMTVVGVLSSHSPEELHNADYIVDDFRAIDLS